MFRKIRSNRDPRDTVYTELKREWGPHFGKAKTRLKSAANNHPRLIFWFMVVNIALSVILSFTVFRRPKEPPRKTQTMKVLAPVNGGIDRIMQTTQALSDMIRVKKAIDSLSGKKQLTAADSATLEKALDRFQQLNKQFNQRK